MSAKSRAAMLRVKYALDHHAEPLKPVAQALQDALDGSGIMHAMKSRLGGANSNYIDLPGSRFYLKGVVRPDPRIEIRLSVRGPVVVDLRNERDVLRWVATL